MSFPEDQLIFNRSHNGMLTEETLSKQGQIAYFEGNASEIGILEARQWLEAIRNNTAPLVKPEQAYVVTQILEAIYRSSESGRDIILN
jgi:predicted dehydrogenase